MYWHILPAAFLVAFAAPDSVQERVQPQDSGMSSAPRESAASSRGEHFAQPAPEVGETVTVTGDLPVRQDLNRRVCRRTVATGSIMPQRTCRTAGEWEQIRLRSLDERERMANDRRARDNAQFLRENNNVLFRQRPN